ncbi:sigma-70 family RNA polymerase sigma factor [bacterium]|nr:sigma-70 family RNA polymerase sigma factor [bacterium]
MKDKLYDVQAEKLVAGALNRYGITPKNRYYDDLFGEACLVFVECQQTYDSSRSKFTTYFFNQVRYRLSQFYRENRYNLAKKDIFFNDSIQTNCDENSIVADIDIENDLINRLELEKIESFPQLFENLKEYELDIVKKVFWENLSFSEIGKIYNKSKQAIQQMLKRVLEKLRVEMEMLKEAI